MGLGSFFCRETATEDADRLGQLVNSLVQSYSFAVLPWENEDRICRKAQARYARGQLLLSIYINII